MERGISNSSGNTEERIIFLEDEVKRLKKELKSEKEKSKKNIDLVDSLSEPDRLSSQEDQQYATLFYKMSEMARLANVGFWEYDVQNDKVEWSDEAYKLFGYPRGTEINYQKIVDRIHPEDREKHDQVTRQWIEGGTCTPFEYRVMLPGGNVRYLYARGKVEKDGKGNTIKMLGAIIDVTSRKQVENELREHKERLEYRVKEHITALDKNQRMLKTITTEAPMVLFAMDKAGRFTFSEGKGLKKFGLKASQLVGLQVFDLYKDHKDIINNVRKVLQGEEVHEVHKIDEYYYDTIYSPVNDKHGRVDGLVGVAIDVTEKINYEEQIRQYNHILEQAQSTAHLGGWEMDIATGKSKWSDEFYRICGFEPGAFEPTAELGMSIIHPEDQERAAKAVNDAITNKSTYNIEKRIIRPNGEIRYIQSQGEIISDELGNAKTLAGSFLDVTERKRAELKLAESEAKFRKMTDNSPLAIYMSSGIEQKAEYVNQTFTKLFGYTINDVPNVAEWWPLAYPDESYREKIIAEWQKRVEKAIAAHAEIEPISALVTCKDGSKKHIVWSFISDGEKNWAFGHDITTRKLTEFKLKESEERFKRVIEASNTGIWEWDLKNDTVYYSPRWKSLIGYKDNEIENKFQVWEELLHPDDRVRMTAELQEYLENPTGNFEKQFRMKHKKGHYVWIQNRSAIKLDRQDRPSIMSGSHQDITRIKTYEEELRKSEVKFRDIFNSITECIIIVTFEGEIVELNKSAELQYGYNREEFMKISPLRLIHEDYHHEFYKFQNQLKTKGHFEGETIDVRKDGSMFYTYVKGSVINYNEKPHLLAVIRDVTHKKAAELELQDAYEFNDLVLSNSPLGIIIYEEKGQCISSNEEGAKVIGAEINKVLSQNFHDIQSWKKSGLYALALDTLSSGKRNQKLLNITTTFNKEVWIDCYLSSFYKKEKKHLLLVVNDITEKTRAQQERERFFNTTLSLLCTANLEGYFIDLNPAWSKTLGYSEGELKANKFLDFIHPDDIEPTLDKVKNLGEGKKVINFTNRYKCKNGEFKYLSWSSICYDNTIYASAIDITQLEKYKVQLEEQTLELQRSNMELEQFAYVASHDLQEPLRKIKNYAQMLGRRLDQHLDEKTNGYMVSLDGAVSRMQNLINDILSLSRVSTRGKDFDECDLNMVLTEVKKILELKTHKTNATLKIGELPVVMADEGQMIQLFQNLVGNAIKFNNNEKPLVEVGLDHKTKEHVTIHVKDNGIGIEDEFVEKIFTIFQRLHSREKYDGTGIGLAICKKIVERHKGDIWVESEPGSGTTFFIQIPVK